MLSNRRTSTSRWWHKKKYWIFFAISLFLVFVRISKGSFYKDLYYFISKPFWPGKFQKEIVLESINQEYLIKLDLLKKDNIDCGESYLFKNHLIMSIFQLQLFREKQVVGGDKLFSVSYTHLTLPTNSNV